LSPGGSGLFPYRYGQANLTLRFYVSPIARYLTMTVRLVGDMQFGNVPFYELARYEETYALGGVNGVRGVPAQRYSGKIKVFGNLELRSELVSGKLFGKELTLALAAYLDAGRVWAEWASRPDLDGSGLGLKYGIGGGLRLQQGQSFVARGDIAWSPDSRPVGAYVTAGQAF
jgi:hemolysin activation/secretion protein